LNARRVTITFGYRKAAVNPKRKYLKAKPFLPESVDHDACAVDANRRKQDRQVWTCGGEAIAAALG
jgi:hypothetical protein